MSAKLDAMALRRSSAALAAAIALVLALLAFALGSAPFTPALLLTAIALPLAALAAWLGAWRQAVLALYFSCAAWAGVPLAQKLSVRIDYSLLFLAFLGLVGALVLYCGYEYSRRREDS